MKGWIVQLSEAVYQSAVMVSVVSVVRAREALNANASDRVVAQDQAAADLHVVLDEFSLFLELAYFRTSVSVPVVVVRGALTAAGREDAVIEDF